MNDNFSLWALDIKYFQFFFTFQMIENILNVL
jgi:hypothetical protein